MIHCYQMNGYNIILDVHSGGVHVVDQLFYQMAQAVEPPLAEDCPRELLDKFSSYGGDAVKETYGEMLELYRQGSLFSPDDYGQFADRMVLSPIKAMCLHISHDCNLRCDYCFAGTGDFGTGHRMEMPLEVGKKAIDFLIEKSEGRRNLELDFFGGEPLMNFGVVEEIVRYAREREKETGKNFRFTVTTNGTLLTDERIDFINREMHNVVLSVDGSGSYDAFLPKFQKLVQRRGDGQYYVRGTFTKYNLDFAEDVLHLNRCGFDQISVEPVVADPKLPYALTEADLPAIFAEYERLAKLLIDRRREGKGFNFFHFMIDLDQGPCVIKRLRGCGAGNEYCAVTPDGDVYPCHQFVGQEEWRMGDIFSGEIDMEMKRRFAASNVYGKEECRNCWAKFYCSGGCNANNHTYAGDITRPYHLACELEKKRVECAIMIKAAMADMAGGEEESISCDGDCAACVK